MPRWQHRVTTRGRIQRTERGRVAGGRQQNWQQQVKKRASVPGKGDWLQNLFQQPCKRCGPSVPLIPCLPLASFVLRLALPLQPLFTPWMSSTGGKLVGGSSRWRPIPSSESSSRLKSSSSSAMPNMSSSSTWSCSKASNLAWAACTCSAGRRELRLDEGGDDGVEEDPRAASDLLPLLCSHHRHGLRDLACSLALPRRFLCTPH